MEQPFRFEAEPFEFYSEFEYEQEGFGSELFEQEWQGEVNRNSTEFVKWVQSSLNRILGLRLAVDGIMGPQTRSAIRSFQQQRGLMVDGIVGPKTENALRAAPSPPSPNTVVPVPRQIWILDGFDFAKSNLRPEHIGEINAIAEFVKASQNTPNPVSAIDLIGHTDPVGSDADNYKLGCFRAWAATKALKDRLGWQLVNRLSFRVASMGEKQPVAGNDSASRRVEVELCYNIVPSLPQQAVRCDLPGVKPPTVQPPGGQPPGGQPPGGQPPGGQPPGGQPPGGQPPACNKSDLARRVNECISESKKCLYYAHAKLLAAGIRCRMNPICNATVLAEYLMALKQCRDALLACDRAAKQSTNCS